MKIFIGVIIGCAVFYFLSAYIQNDIAWFELLYNDGIVGAMNTDRVDRALTLVLFVFSGAIGAFVTNR